MRTLFSIFGLGLAISLTMPLEARSEQCDQNAPLQEYLRCSLENRAADLEELARSNPSVECPDGRVLLPATKATYLHFVKCNPKYVSNCDANVGYVLVRVEGHQKQQVLCMPSP